MGSSTGIEWTDATANFWRGCAKVTPGCAHCYMFTQQRRYGRDPEVVTRCSPQTFFAPLRSARWRARAAQFQEDEGRRMRVFTCSWSDFFHVDADEWREEAWEVIRSCPEYDWQILTKRPELVAERLPADWGEGWPHVWLGVSIENRRFVGRAETLRGLPAAVRFISAEPLLGPLMHDAIVKRQSVGISGVPPETAWLDGFEGPALELAGIDWLIVGGESGPGARPMREEWVGALRDECLRLREPRAFVGGWHNLPKLHRVAFFFKQWGGPKPGGPRELDGRTWSEFPRSPAAVVVA